MEAEKLYLGAYHVDGEKHDRTIIIPASSLEEAQSRLQACSQGCISHSLPSNAAHVPVFACHYSYEGKQYGIGIAAQSTQEAEQSLRALADTEFIILYDLPCSIHLPDYATYGDVMHALSDLSDTGCSVGTKTLVTVNGIGCANGYEGRSP